MDYEEKLKKALQFLLDTNAKGASYDYYDKKAEGHQYDNWLFKYLTELEIAHNEQRMLVTELAKRDLIDVYPPESKINATPPHQIKISFKGMVYLNPTDKGKIDEKQSESITALQMAVLTLQKKDLEDKPKEKLLEYKRALFGICVGSVLTGLLAYFLQKDQTNTVINQVPTQKISLIYDTIFVKSNETYHKK